MQMQRVFITGGTGFFGKSMLDYRLRHPEWDWAKAEWVVLSRSPARFVAEQPELTNQDGVSFVAGDVRDFHFPEGKFDAIIHAATSAAAAISDEEMMSVAVEGTRHVIDFAKAIGRPKILFTSSGAVYGSRSEPAREEDSCNPTTAYGKGKLESERLLLASGLDVNIARCFAFVGPYLDRKAHYAIGNFIQDCLDGCDIVIKGDGTPLRSYLYSDDLVEWLFAILQRGHLGRAYNVGSDESMSIREVADRVCAVLGGDRKVVVKGTPNGGVPSVYVPDVSRAINELGVRVSIPFAEAIRWSSRRYDFRSVTKAI